MTTQKPEVLTFGCRLNIAESEILQKHAEALGMDGVVIVNTCAVTNEAERQAGQAIRRIKRERPDAKILVTGCASHIDPQKYAAMEGVERVIPNDAKLKIESYRAFSGTEEAKAVAPMPPALAPLQRAFVQIQNGCDHRCTFCVIPFGRGASRSMRFEDVIAETRAYVQEGYREVVLTGVDIASYGRDLPGQPTLGTMIRFLLRDVPDLPRLRLSSLDPAEIDEDLWELIEAEPRLMPHVHLSLQAGDDMILKRMKRRHSRDDILRLCERARQARPDIVFGADVIAGFPTETDEMFENTYNLVKDCALTWLHVFPYSARKGTPAAKMPQVPSPVRKERAERLRLLGEKAAESYYKGLIGTKIQVLVENKGIGCTPSFAKLHVQGKALVGTLVDVRCIAMENKGVLAEIISS